MVLGKTTRVEEADVAAMQASGGRDAQPSVTGDPAVHPLPPDALNTSIREMTMRHVARVLQHTGGDKVAAATILEVDVSTLYRWLHRGPKRRKPR
ncbi:MAG: hypothetical protein U0270_30150 [Labilithrix sp.]